MPRGKPLWKPQTTKQAEYPALSRCLILSLFCCQQPVSRSAFCVLVHNVSLYFTASSLVSTIKICQTKNFAGSFVFSKSQRKWERLSARGKNGNKKPLLHGCVSFHVAAVYAVVIQLKFQKDRLEFMNLMPLPMINIFLSFS